MPQHAAAERLPVMVWIYGGAFLLGASEQYDPTRLVRDGKVIVAIPNYRLGPFGFLALPELAAAAHGITGTYGTLDQQLALRWVHDNAAAFGGDPGNVTIFGESAGGMGVCTQLVSPTARGLFAKAISESGSCARSPLTPPAKPDAYRRSAAYAASMGCADASTRPACLRALPVDKLLDSPTTRLTSMKVTWTPSLDGVVLTRTPEDALAAGAARGIPFIVGSNADEGSLFVALTEYANGILPTPAGYPGWVRDLFGANTDRVLARYPLSAYPSADEAERHILTDGFFACPAQFTADAANRGGEVVWKYQFNQAPLGYNPIVPGSFHSAEILYLFSGGEGLRFPLPPADDLLSRQLQSSWAHFAYTGRPDIPPFAMWQPWQPGDRPTMQLGGNALHADTTTFVGQHHCDLWSTIPRIG